MDKVLVIDFGGQYNQLIARRIRELSVYAEIKPYDISAEEVLKAGYKAVVFTGSPNSVYLEDSPHCDPKILELGLPVLGICYGCQDMSFLLGGHVTGAGASSEYGKTEIIVDRTGGAEDALLQGVPDTSIFWMRIRKNRSLQ